MVVSEPLCIDGGIGPYIGVDHGRQETIATVWISGGAYVAFGLQVGIFNGNDKWPGIIHAGTSQEKSS
ncbi:hypothetical protein NPIL_166901 [Nephila pilipes]|uniref:Uncharacterized protein n=1 Tax=Nephila pilipes TaxID=299642 RepID=A0A8X6U3B0_NEPPI|nr:hypothetical protein NPIL_166901 [Nephila pilipes]